MPLLLGPPPFVFLCLAELVTKSTTWSLSFMSQRCGNIFLVVYLPTSGISEIYYCFCNSKDKSKQKSGNPEMWIHKYLLKFHCICLFLTTLCVHHWVFYTYRCNVLHLSSASQLFPWAPDMLLITSSLLEWATQTSLLWSICVLKILLSWFSFPVWNCNFNIYSVSWFPDALFTLSEEKVL